MPEPSPYIWLPDLQRYRDTATGRFVSSAEVRDWGQTSMNDSADHARGMASALTEHGISLSQWESNMRDQIKEEYVRQYLLGRGGRDLMTAVDWGSVGGMCADQYRYLDGFAAEIAAGELSEKQIAARSEMYLRSSREAFERGRDRAQPDATEIRWHTTAAESCVDCIAYDDMGWQSIADDPYGGNVPGSGGTRCLTNCMCYTMRR
jgi:hypothetical protein